MKKYIGEITILTAILSFWGNVVAADLRNGFMGYKWGGDISLYSELHELKTKGDVTYYSNPGESYRIDDIQIGDAVLGFYRGNLFAAYIGIDAPETYDRILSNMKLKYGLPDTKTSAKEHVTTIKWKYQGISIKLKTNDVEGRMKLAFYYNKLTRDFKKSQLEQMSETSFRFFPIDKHKTPRLIPFLEF